MLSRGAPGSPRGNYKERFPELRIGQRKSGIQLHRTFIKLFALLQIGPQLFAAGEIVVRLHIKHVGFAVLSGRLAQARGFSGRELRLQRGGDLKG